VPCTNDYRIEIEKFYSKGEIDSVQKARVDKYLQRAEIFANFESERKFDTTDQAFKDKFFKLLTYRKLIDSASLPLKPWPGEKIVRATAISYPDTGSAFILKEGKHTKDGFYPEDYSISDKSKVEELRPDQIQKLLDGMNGFWPGGEYIPSNSAACFMPHHGIFLYGEKDKVVAYIEICFTCSAFRIHPQELSRYKGALEEQGINLYLYNMTPLEKLFNIKSGSQN